jgi:hypothetical protein
MDLSPNLSLPLSRLPLRGRLARALAGAGFEYVGDVVTKTPAELTALDGLGEVALRDLKFTLADLGFGIEIPASVVRGWVRPHASDIDDQPSEVEPIAALEWDRFPRRIEIYLQPRFAARLAVAFRRLAGGAAGARLGVGHTRDGTSVALVENWALAHLMYRKPRVNQVTDPAYFMPHRYPPDPIVFENTAFAAEEAFYVDDDDFHVVPMAPGTLERVADAIDAGDELIALWTPDDDGFEDPDRIEVYLEVVD